MGPEVSEELFAPEPEEPKESDERESVEAPEEAEEPEEKEEQVEKREEPKNSALSEQGGEEKPVESLWDSLDKALAEAFKEIDENGKAEG